MKSAHAIIAEVPDFWMDQVDSEMELGEHNADRIIDALETAGYVIVEKRYAQSPPKVYRIEGEPQEQAARRDAE